MLDNALQLIQAVVTKKAPKPALWFVTRGAQMSELVDVTHAGVWGLARTARNEHPDTVIGCMDLQPGAKLAEQFRSVGVQESARTARAVSV